MAEVVYRHISNNTRAIMDAWYAENMPGATARLIGARAYIEIRAKGALLVHNALIALGYEQGVFTRSGSREYLSAVLAVCNGLSGDMVLSATEGMKTVFG